MANTNFRRTKLNTWKANNDWCHTAQLFRDGEPNGTIAVSSANEYCEKWNGYRGNFEVK